MAHVTTFYSYKGGVGRSLLMANVGVILAQEQFERVLLWDLDVEAPGLHRIPQLRPAPVDEGFLEWLGDLTDAEPPMSDMRVERLRALVKPVPKVSRLHILPAFGDESDFVKAYLGVDWSRLLVEERGVQLFRAVVETLGSEFDHVLIDSRTGVSDLGGLLTVVLPDLLVLVGGYGRQSIRGLADMSRAFQLAFDGKLDRRLRPDPRHKLRVHRVLSPVPSDTVDAAESRRVWHEVNGDRPRTEVAWDRRLLFGEKLLSLNAGERAQAAHTGTSPVHGYLDVAAMVHASRRELIENLEVQATHEPGTVSSASRGGPTERGQRFEDRVARLLELLDYRIERERPIGGADVDLIARLEAGIDPQTFWVGCKEHPRVVGRLALERLAALVKNPQARTERAKGMVVARSFTPAALAFARDHPELHALTVDHLERLLFDPRPYLQQLVSGFEQDPIARTWVRQRVELEDFKDKTGGFDLLEHGVAWARGQGRRLWLLLGDFGTGKTAFFKRFTYELAKNALEDPAAPFPIAVDLKTFPNATSLDMLLHEHVRAKLNRSRGTPEVLLHLLSTGRAVLVLDGFDEMGVAAAGRSVDEQFRLLAHASGSQPLDPRGNRVLITCRTHFFRDQQHAKDAAQGRLEGITASQDSELGKLARRFDATIDELMLFDDAQIRDFLQRHLGSPEKADEALTVIRRTYDLTSLAPRPVLLEMIVASLPSLVKSGTEVTPASLYDVYLRQWIEDRSGGNLQTRPALRLKLLGLLAAVLWAKPDRRIHHTDLLAEVRRMESHFPGLDPERVDLELRTAAFLVRSTDGYYRFAHKSFLEMCFARRIREAAEESPAALVLALATERVTPEVTRFFWALPPPTPPSALQTLSLVLQAPYVAAASENALRLASAHPGNPVIPRAQLSGAKLAGESLDHDSLPDADLSHACLDDAWLSNANLTGAKLSGAQLSRAQLDDAVLSNLQASGIAAVRASWTGARMENARLQGADLSGSNLRGARLRSANLSGASLRYVELAGADLDDANADGADVTGVAGAGQPIMLGSKRPDRLVPVLATPADVQTAAWRDDGVMLATGGVGGIHLWDAASGTSVGRVPAATPLRFVHDGRLAVDNHGITRLWDPAQLALSRETPTAWWPAWSESGRWLVFRHADKVECWDVSTGLQRWSQLRSLAMSLSFNADETRVISMENDGRVVELDASTGEELAARQSGVPQLRIVAWDRLGRRAIGVQLGSGRVVLLDTSMGTRWIIGAPLEGPRVPTDDNAAVEQPDCIVVDKSPPRPIFQLISAAFSPDGKQLAITTPHWDQVAVLLDCDAGTVLARLSGGAVAGPAAWSRTGKLVQVRAGRAQITDVATARASLILPLRGWVPDGLVMGATGRFVGVVVGGMLRVWEVENDLALPVDAPVYGVGDLDERAIGAFADDHGCVVRRIDQSTSIGEISGLWHSGVISIDGNRIVLAGQDRVGVFTTDGVLICYVRGRWDGAEISADGRRVALVRNRDVAVADADSGEILWKKPGNHIGLSGDGASALVWSGFHVSRLSAADGTEIWRARHNQHARGGALSRAGTMCALADGREISVRDAAGRWLWRNEHAAPLVHVGFLGESRVVSAGEDCTVRVWDATTGRCLRVLGVLREGWWSVEPHTGSHRGDSMGLAQLVYVDPDDHSVFPTHWHAIDLPDLHDAGRSAPRESASAVAPPSGSLHPRSPKSARNSRRKRGR